ncbi:MAG TPA: extracellular solute-binding protein [Candidatus Acidoferrales bacterium]|nr:extracellular solute-binding protein [Candidatus Acidoferrales bacterium]
MFPVNYFGVVILLAVLNVASTASSQTKKPATLAELAVYSGADREQLLLAGAKAEGKVVWFTSFTGSSYKELARSFEARYPAVKVEIYRAANKELQTKLMAEIQTNHHLADSIESTLPLLQALRESGMLVPYASPHAGQYAAAAKEKTGNELFYWLIHRESYNGVGYNTDLIPAAAVPKTFADLLKPQFKGKMGFANGDTGARMIGAMLKVKGEEYVKKLQTQNYSLHSISARAVADLVASGELELSPTISFEHAAEVKGKGGPVGWTPMEVVPTNAGGAALVAHAPHPHAALLMVDFIASPQGRKIFGDQQQAAVARELSSKRWYPESGLTSAQYEDRLEQWLKLLRDVKRK